MGKSEETLLENHPQRQSRVPRTSGRHARVLHRGTPNVFLFPWNTAIAEKGALKTRRTGGPTAEHIVSEACSPRGGGLQVHSAGFSAQGF